MSYWTDLDLHEQPHLLANHRCLVSLGHDEYWSADMRYGVQAAVDAGLNFAVLGANCCYRHIRLQPSPLGTFRRQVCYKDGAEDPLFGVNNAEVTSNWEDGPDARPESQLIGVEYQSFGGSGDLVVAEASSFAFAGTGLVNGSRIPDVVGSEFDAYVPQSPSPANLEVLCHASTGSANGPSTVDTGYYTVDGGGGVFASGTASWVNRMWDNNGILPTPFAPTALPPTAAVSRITLNVLAAFSKGPASRTHPVERQLAEVLHARKRHARPGSGDESLRPAGRRARPSPAIVVFGAQLASQKDCDWSQSRSEASLTRNSTIATDGLRGPSRPYPTSSAISRIVGTSPATSKVVTSDSRQRSRSSRIFSFGPIRQIASTSWVGTRAAASSLRPSR